MAFKTEYLLFPDGVTARYRMERSWSRQPKPYSHPQPFVYTMQNASGTVFSYNNGDVIYGDPGGVVHRDLIAPLEVTAQNSAYAQIVGKLGSSSQWANNLIEAKDSIAMIEGRAKQLASFANAVRKGNFGKAANILSSPGHPVKPGFRPKAKAFGDQFLEYHFGWEPAIKDVHDACQTMSKADFGSQRVTSSAHANNRAFDHSQTGSGQTLKTRTSSATCTVQVKCGAVVRISNPNAYLASQLGLVNPLSVAWEAVPFSFVVDWFANVGQVCASISDFVGLSVQDAYTTTSHELTGNVFQYDASGNPNIGGSGNWTAKEFKVERVTGIPVPRLAVKPFKGFSATRGVTAISLLLQQLRG